MCHTPLVRFPPTRNPDYEARRLKRRFTAVWRRYEKDMARRRRLRWARGAALFRCDRVGRRAYVLLDRLLSPPAGTLIGLATSLLLGGFLLLGRHPSSVIFVALGTLTGSYAADRLARGWYYLGGQNGIPSIPSMSLGSYDIT